MRPRGATAERQTTVRHEQSNGNAVMRWGGRLLTAAALAASLAACDSGKATTAHVAPTSTARPGYTYNITETQYFGANTFERYQNASIMGPYLNIGDEVVAACLIYDPKTPVKTTRGFWYKLQTPKATDGNPLYAPANTFANEVPGDPPDRQNAYDPRLEICDESPSRDLPPPHH